MSPFPRLRWTSPEIEDGQWYEDRLGCFRERYYVRRQPTPYVRLDDPEIYIWDLGFSNRFPGQREASRVDCLVLSDISGWLELRDGFLSFSWSPYRHRGDASAFVALHTLEQFQVEVMADPEQVQLIVQAENRAPIMPRALERTTHSGIRISMIFGREHEPALRDLCAYAEEQCRRPLAGRNGPPAEGPPAVANKADPANPEAVPSATPVDRAAGPGPDEPMAGTPVPAHERDVEPAAHDADAPPGRTHIRPAIRTLAVAVDVAPDTAGWLSFVGPTTQDLLSPLGTNTDASQALASAAPPGYGDPGQAAD